MTDYYPIFELYQAMRAQLMELLVDADLSYSPGGSNPPLGVLCREIGEVERAYIDSFKTLKLDFSYRNRTPGLENSVARLTAWYIELDAELKATIAGLSQQDIASKRVDRGQEFQLPLRVQLSIYQEALLIFHGKVMVYLHAKGLTPSRQMRAWLDGDE